MYHTFFRSILTIILFFSCLSGNAQARTRPITVMSYNIHFGVGMDGIYNIDRIADVIKKSKADIIGIQEADVYFDPRTNFDNQMKILAEKLHMNYFFAPIYDFDPFYRPLYYAHPDKAEKRRQSGVGVLSRFPIEKAKNHPLIRLSTMEPNPAPLIMPGFAETVINIYGTRVPFFVTHLDYRPDKKIREAQVREMLPIISRQNGESILAGDLNVPPAEPELAPLLKIYQDTLVDCRDKKCLTFPADSPTMRLDFVLASSGFQVESAHVMPEPASDHRPVVAILQIKAKTGEK